MYDHATPTVPLRIRELPVGERPVSRLLDVGTQALADTELLAILIQADTLDAAAQLLCHCGVCETSPNDILVTRTLVQAGERLGIDVLDHLVIGQGRFVSMRERGLGLPL